jgi:hypothetical protein
MILPEAPDKDVPDNTINPCGISPHYVDVSAPHDWSACCSIIQGTDKDWSELYKKVIEAFPEYKGPDQTDPVQLADKIEELQRGNLYDILYQGRRETGFFCRFEEDKAIFFCFNFECQGDYLFFPSEEIVVVEHPEQNLASLARAIYFECDRIKWLLEFMKWDNDASFVVARARKG